MKYLKNKALIVILITYLFVIIFASIYYPTFYTNILNPIFWLCILSYLIWISRKFYIRYSTNRKYFIYMLIISSIYVLLYFYIGFILGFSKSPYNHGILGILKNAITQILPIISIEVARAVIVLRNKNNKLLLISITIILILLEINYGTLLNLYSNKEQFFEYICSTILPLIANSALYTYLALKGSYSLSLIFRLFYKSIVLVLPILPNTDWFITGSTSILSSTFIYILFKYKFTREQSDLRKKPENTFTKISYILIFVLSFTLIGFMVGFFRYEPISILSNSMDPMFSRGDVVIYKKLTDNELNEISENSIIIYSIGTQNVAHRVCNIIENNENISYQTKGDNNNAPDPDLVQIDQIKGIYVFHIKYIGFPSIWLYEYFNNEDAKVETQ